MDDGLLVIHPRVEFRHPLVRSAVYSGATTEERRRAHHALANVMDVELDSDRRALHMALGAVGPDEELAVALEQSAAHARSRGGYAADTSFLVRSASLTPDPQRRASRLLAAAHAAFLAGNASHSESLLQQARPYLVDPIEKAKAQRLDGDLRYSFGEPHLGASLLIGAARAFEPLDRVLSHYALLEAFVALGAAMHLTEGTTGVEVAQTALKSLSAQSTPTTAADLLLKGVALRYCGDYADAVPVMREAVRAQATMSPEEINRWQQGIVLAEDLWDETLHRDIVDRHEDAACAQGSLSALQVTLLALVQNDLRSGRFVTARERYSELHDVTTMMGGFVQIYDLFDVQLLAWQGDRITPAKATELRDFGIAVRSQSVVYLADFAVLTFALGEGQYEAALRSAKSVAEADHPGWAVELSPQWSRQACVAATVTLLRAPSRCWPSGLPPRVHRGLLDS